MLDYNEPAFQSFLSVPVIFPRFRHFFIAFNQLHCESAAFTMRTSPFHHAKVPFSSDENGTFVVRMPFCRFPATFLYWFRLRPFRSSAGFRSSFPESRWRFCSRVSGTASWCFQSST